MSKVYVKAYAKEKSGTINFYKDGYTDLRGNFDYASLNSGDISNFEKFSVFVMSDELGSTIKEITPPSKLGKYEMNAICLKSKNWKAKEKI